MSIEIKGRQEFVTTITGAQAKRSNCITNKETGVYYEKNISCFQIDMGDGRLIWHRIDNGKIGWNCESKRWELIKYLENSSLLKGFYNTSLQQGWFKKSEETVYLKEVVYQSSSTPCIDANTALKLGYIECLHDEYFYNKKNMNSADVKYITTPQIVKYGRDFEFNYNAADNNSSFRNIKEAYSRIEIPISNRTHDVSKMLFGKSFGIEIESRNGSLPQKLLNKLGLVPLKDGSLRLDNGAEPYEYATVPFYGAKGLETIKNICAELNKRCEFDESCSLHIHLGNVKYDETTILAYYILIQTIQEELYSIFPMYKRSEMEYLGKPKNYNSPLPNIGLLTNTLFKKQYDTKQAFEADTQKYFSKIIEHLTDGQFKEFKEWNTPQTFHPLGAQKWNIHSRKIKNDSDLVQ